MVGGEPLNYVLASLVVFLVLLLIVGIALIADAGVRAFRSIQISFAPSKEVNAFSIPGRRVLPKL
jgi:hypothetical protein